MTDAVHTLAVLAFTPDARLSVSGWSIIKSCDPRPSAVADSVHTLRVLAFSMHALVGLAEPTDASPVLASAPYAIAVRRVTTCSAASIWQHSATSGIRVV